MGEFNGSGYDPLKNQDMMKKAEEKFKAGITKHAGENSLKGRVKKSLMRLDYNATRWATMDKNQPKAKAFEKAIMDKQQGR